MSNDEVLRRIREEAQQGKFQKKDIPCTDVMHFGIHKGEKLGNVPAHYLIWLYDNDRAHGNIKEYITQNKELLQQQATKERNT